jgi:hypothetical protein
MKLIDILNEGRWSKMMKSVRTNSESGPWTLVVIDRWASKKVVHQEVVNIRDLIPAVYERIKKDFSGKLLSIEDNTGAQVYTEMLK